MEHGPDEQSALGENALIANGLQDVLSEIHICD